MQFHCALEVYWQALPWLEDAEPPEGGHAGEREVEVREWVWGVRLRGE